MLLLVRSLIGCALMLPFKAGALEMNKWTGLVLLTLKLNSDVHS